MTEYRFELTRLRLGRRRDLVVSASPEPTVTIESASVHEPYAVPVTAIGDAVVLRAPSRPSVVDSLGLGPENRYAYVFGDTLPDGTMLAIPPVVVDLTTSGRPTLALVLRPPQQAPLLKFGDRRADFMSWRRANRGKLEIGVVLCSPADPTAVATCLAGLHVAVSDDACAIAITRFGEMPANQARAVGSRRSRKTRIVQFANLAWVAVLAASYMLGKSATQEVLHGVGVLGMIVVVAVQTRSAPGMRVREPGTRLRATPLPLA